MAISHTLLRCSTRCELSQVDDRTVVGNRPLSPALWRTTLPSTSPGEAQAVFSASLSRLNFWCWARMCSCVAPWFGTSG